MLLHALEWLWNYHLLISSQAAFLPYTYTAYTCTLYLTWLLHSRWLGPHSLVSRLHLHKKHKTKGPIRHTFQSKTTKRRRQLAGMFVLYVYAWKGASEAPRTHFRACKILTFSGCMPPHPLQQSVVWAPLSVFALGPHNLLSSVPSKTNHYSRTQAAWEEKNGLVSTVCACVIIPRKTWELVYVWKHQYVPASNIFLYHLKVQPFAS